MTDLSHLARAGATLTLRVTPNARTAAIRAEGDTIHVRVTVPPEKGKANAAVLKALSKALGVPRTRLEIASGATGRNKTLRVL
ncbi:DUF167 domain-containing protein [Palleronia sp.]|uniref:DUF167 domain-containing protein n=1 Tax=Palleronia sp. TaxID=1940284 RepID=UPI0035C857E2